MSKRADTYPGFTGVFGVDVQPLSEREKRMLYDGVADILKKAADPMVFWTALIEAAERLREAFQLDRDRVIKNRRLQLQVAESALRADSGARVTLSQINRIAVARLRKCHPALPERRLLRMVRLALPKHGRGPAPKDALRYGAQEVRDVFRAHHPVPPSTTKDGDFLHALAVVANIAASQAGDREGWRDLHSAAEEALQLDWVKESAGVRVRAARRFAT